MIQRKYNFQAGTKISSNQMDEELQNSQQTLEKYVGAGNVQSFATPFGSYDATVIAEILKYYQSQRSTDAGFNTKDSIYLGNIKVQNILSTTTLVEYTGWIDKAIADNAWLVLIYHRVANDPGTYDSYISDFTAQMQYVNSSGITVLPVSEAISEISPQLV
jgi:hypothetical protein